MRRNNLLLMGGAGLVAAEREAERQEEERRARARDERVGRILARYEKALAERWERAEAEADRGVIDDLLTRLTSPIAAVRRLALGRLGSLANRDAVLDAVGEALRRWEPDDRTARLIAGLPLSPESRKRLAEGLASRAAFLPDFLVAVLLELRITERPDTGLLERYLRQAMLP